MSTRRSHRKQTNMVVPYKYFNEYTDGLSKQGKRWKSEGQSLIISSHGREALESILLTIEEPEVPQPRISPERIRDLEIVRDDHSWIKQLKIDNAIAAQRTMLHVNRAFRFVELLVPHRVSKEEIGDALELMEKHFKRSPARWPAYVKLVTTILWIAVNTVRYMVGSRHGKRAGSSE